MSAPAQEHFSDQPVLTGEAAALFAGLADETRLLVAVSGGPDSVVLLALLSDWARQPGRPELVAATVDHGLRAASAGEAEAVAALCRELGVPHAILRWSGPKPASGIQERARQARYSLLAQHADGLGGAVLVTAHTLDDQAETMLMRMARGSGPSGLLGMRSRVRKGAIDLARPLLGVPKARLIATADARGLPFIQDPSNADTRFERVRWRGLMPALAEEGLGAERLATLASRLGRIEAAVEHRVAALLPLLVPSDDGAAMRLDLTALAGEPDEVVLRLIGRGLEGVAARGDGENLPRLERLEACAFALIDAAGRGLAMTRTLSGCVLALDRKGALTFAREPMRRRGVHPAP
ncbi:tRNA lysidine(34) synthetase TilS [Bosea caraganae]|uniref:tRNA lysidine(34) synthetase TilS n=1 Tax=Bosea caraganae TaxID=2763117 RepID=UPI0015F015F5|nr:tRNA lysidine(34) synthetase TilS [Bosea caraganae]